MIIFPYIFLWIYKLILGEINSHGNFDLSLYVCIILFSYFSSFSCYTVMKTDQTLIMRIYRFNSVISS